MKYKIVYDNNKNTIRLRVGKYAFSKQQGYGLSKTLSEKIDEVKVSSTNGSIYIKFM